MRLIQRTFPASLCRCAAVLLFAVAVSFTTAAEVPICDDGSPFRISEVANDGNATGRCFYADEMGAVRRIVVYRSERPGEPWLRAGEQWFDAHGRLGRVASYAKGRPGRIDEWWVEADGSSVHDVLDGEGRRQTRTIRWPDRPGTEQSYDREGEAVVAVNGTMTDEAAGSLVWGETVYGAVCASTTFQSTGRLSEIMAFVTIWNPRGGAIPIEAEYLDRVVDLQLTDSDGRVLRPTRLDSKVLRKDSPKLLTEGQAHSNFIKLERWFPSLKAGEYQLVMRRGLAVDELSVACGRGITIVVE